MGPNRENKVIAHLLDGSLIKGRTLDFLPSKPSFHITDLEGKIHELQVASLKALFFVRDFEPGPSGKERKGFFRRGYRGRKVMVEFYDGEVLFGYTLTFSTRGLGFFMTPGDPNCNNEKVFVVHSSTKRVRIQRTTKKGVPTS